MITSRILSMLDAAEYRRLELSLDWVSLSENEELCGPEDLGRHVYFPNNAVISLVFDVAARRTLDVAMEGNESAVGFVGHLGSTGFASRSIVRHAGTAMRLKVDALKENENLRRLLGNYVQALMSQVAQTAACNQFHNIDARFARWLLMTRDRIGSPQFNATHNSIAERLGVRRSSVTAVAGDLQRLNVIDYTRGRIRIVDDRKLNSSACSCYGKIKRQYDSFLGVNKHQGSVARGSPR